jgi:hypothetical protein
MLQVVRLSMLVTGSKVLAAAFLPVCTLASLTA